MVIAPNENLDRLAGKRGGFERVLRCLVNAEPHMPGLVVFCTDCIYIVRPE